MDRELLLAASEVSATAEDIRKSSEASISSEEPVQSVAESEPESNPADDYLLNAAAFLNGPLPQTKSVDVSYLDDAAFLGDSITEGMTIHNPSNAVIVSATSMSTYGVAAKPIDKFDGMTLLDKLNSLGSRKIYVMLGANEIGGSNLDVFITRYGDIIDSIKENNPKAAIYVQSITPVTKAYELEGHLLNTKCINEANQLIEKMAHEKKIFFADVHSALVDEEGYLPDNASPKDGVHFGGTYFRKWIDFLLSHTVPDEVIQTLNSMDN
jgi:lysophospholipase L1-like esterase